LPPSVSGIGGVLKREPHEQLLEPTPLPGVVPAVAADAGEDVARKGFPA